MPTEPKRVKCDQCGSVAIIQFVQIPVVDLGVTEGGSQIPDWTCVVECPKCGTSQQTLPLKPPFDNRN
jgi:hypothetical protein